MNRNMRVLMALLAAICVTLMLATDDPETGMSGVNDEMVLSIIFVLTLLGSLRILKRINQMR